MNIPYKKQLSKLYHFTRFYLHFAGHRFYILQALEILNHSMQGVGLLLILPLLSLAGYIEQKVSGTFFDPLTNYLQSFDFEMNIYFIIGFYLLLNVLLAFSLYFQSIINVRLQQSFLLKIRSDMYAKLLRTEWKYLLTQQLGTMTFTSTTDVNQVHFAGIQFVNIAKSTLQTGIGIALCGLISMKLTLMACLTGSLYLVIQIYFHRPTFHNASLNREALRQLFGEVIEGLSGLKLIKSHANEEKNIQYFTKRANDLSTKIEERQKLVSLQTLLQSLIVTILVAIYTVIALNFLNVSGVVLTLFIVILARITGTIKQWITQFDHLLKALPSFNAYQSQLEEMAPHAEYLKSEDAFSPVKFEDSLTLSNVSFKYPLASNQKALRNINLTIHAKQTTAITGPSGSGKTTLIDLILGILVPNEGAISIDGIPLIGSLRRNWRHCLAYVPQEPFLLHDSIRNNLLQFASTSTESQIWNALEAVQARDFVSRLPKGLDTLVGDRGIRLSGGERQRIALARALLRNPQVLILDEATSNLDIETEKAIQQSIDSLHGSMTILIIAHRTSTIEKADRTVILKNGQILEVS